MGQTSIFQRLNSNGHNNTTTALTSFALKKARLGLLVSGAGERGTVGEIENEGYLG